MWTVAHALIGFGSLVLILGFGVFQYYHFFQGGTVSKKQMLTVGRFLLGGITSLGIGLWVLFA